jgi:hypothetical protein
MDDACFTTKQGKEIFILNFEGHDVESALPLVEECAKQVRQRPEKSVLTLTVATNLKFTPAFVDKLKELTRGNEPHVRKAAVVGITGLLSVAMSAVSIFSKREFKQFDSKEEAIKYLMQE